MDAVEEVKSRLSIEDVVSEYVQLKRSGRNWKGLSPFSNEKTPSFMVSAEKQIWHDFSSGKGGDMFSFVMAMEGLDFRGSLELLARKAGVDLEQFQGQSNKSRPNKEKLHEILELSTKFYQTQLSSSKQVIDYVFKKRQFTKQTALEWRLGYSPNNGKALVDFLKKRGYNDNDLKLAGLVSRYGSDLFRGRLMIPLCDPQGKVVGFTARILVEDKDAPKYINTPSTPLYDKSRHVFGLDLAKAAIRKEKFVVLAEGNLDVIMSHQAGVKQVVATAGTALTEQHLKALSRLTGDIRLSFDADMAGLNATERAIPIASKTKVSLSIVTIPSGKDPDELIKQDVEVWQKVIQSPQYALDWLLQRYESQLDLASAQGKRQFSDVLLPVVKALTDPVEQDHYLGKIAEKIETSKDALLAKMAQSRTESSASLKRRKPAVELPPRAELEQSKQQDQLLCLVLLRPELRSYLDFITPEMFAAQQSRDLLAFLIAHPDFSGAGDSSEEALRPLETYVKILGVQYEELYQGLEITELHYEAARLQARLIETYVKNQKLNLAAQMRDADGADSQHLLIQARELDALLGRVTGGTYNAQSQEEQQTS
ncbi:DNA primase [soil metagenome]